MRRPSSRFSKRNITLNAGSDVHRSSFDQEEHFHKKSFRTNSSISWCYKWNCYPTYSYKKLINTLLVAFSCFIIACSATVFRATGGVVSPTLSTRPNDTNESNLNSCSVYLAPASIPGGGKGFYTSIDVKKGDIIHPADFPAIPIIDPDYSRQSRDAWVDLFSGYWWGHGSSDATLFESKKAVDFQGGIGAFPNTHAYLANLKIGFPQVVPLDDSILDRAVNPGAGASSYNLGRHAIASRDIEAGEEIFLIYPEQELNRLSEKYNVPNREDFTEAGRWVSNLLKLFQRNEIPWKQIFEVPLFGAISDRITSLLPKSQLDLDEILASSKNSNDPSDLSLAIAREMSVEKRSVEWIQENGFCMDNIKIGKSSNSQAGKGGFAQRLLKKGDVIVPAPMLHINDRDALKIPAFEGKATQLLLNYCFGHDESSLLLCPYSNALLLNHCSARRTDLHSCGQGKTPNAEYLWSKWDTETDSWLEKDIEDMKKTNERVPLSLDIVATRDIEAGEELFLDYGEKWEEAWDQHLHDWVPVKQVSSETGSDGGKWKSAKVLNDELLPLTVAPDFSEKYVSTDSRGVLFTGCLYSPRPNADNNEQFWEGLDQEIPWEDMSVVDIIAKFGGPADHDYDIVDDASYPNYTDGSFWPCVVTKHKADLTTENYTVRIVQSWNQDTALWEEKAFPRIITDYPRGSIRHFYLPYESDLHLPNAFRHHIEFRNDIFPEQWKDKKK